MQRFFSMSAGNFRNAFLKLLLVIFVIQVAVSGNSRPDDNKHYLYWYNNTYTVEVYHAADILNKKNEPVNQCNTNIRLAILCFRLNNPIVEGNEIWGIISTGFCGWEPGNYN